MDKAMNGTDMPTMRLGALGLQVSRLGLGCMGMSEFYGDTDEAQSLRVLDRAVELGVTFFDTADMYGCGRNEHLVGRGLRSVRGDVIIATKFGNVRNERGDFLGISGRPEYVKASCDSSLRRLGIEVIDLYYQHRVDPQVPIEETVGAMAELVNVGKVRFLGLSEASAATIRRAHAEYPIAAVQTEYSLWSREPEQDILPVCRELGIGFVPYSPLGRGFLAGQFARPEDLPENDWRRKSPRFQPENFRKNLALLDRVKGMAEKKRCTPAQFALAWVLRQGGVCPIPGTRRVERLEENLGALQLTWTPEELPEIESHFPIGTAAGERYDDRGMRVVNG